MPRIIVRRGCADTYAQLVDMFADETDVEIVWDRRERDRRAVRLPIADDTRARDRRRQDRRRRPTQTWLTLDFVVVKD